MTAHLKSLKDVTINLNSFLGMISVVGIITQGIVLFVTLRSIPDDLSAVKTEQQRQNEVLIVQSTTLKTLADVSLETKVMRRDLDKNIATLEALVHRITTLERNQKYHN